MQVLSLIKKGKMLKEIDIEIIEGIKKQIKDKELINFSLFFDYYLHRERKFGIYFWGTDIYKKIAGGAADVDIELLEKNSILYNALKRDAIKYADIIILYIEYCVKNN